MRRETIKALLGGAACLLILAALIAYVTADGTEDAPAQSESPEISQTPSGLVAGLPVEFYRGSTESRLEPQEYEPELARLEVLLIRLQSMKHGVTLARVRVYDLYGAEWLVLAQWTFTYGYYPAWELYGFSDGEPEPRPLDRSGFTDMKIVLEEGMAYPVLEARIESLYAPSGEAGHFVYLLDGEEPAFIAGYRLSSWQEDLWPDRRAHPSIAACGLGEAEAFSCNYLGGAREVRYVDVSGDGWKDIVFEGTFVLRPEKGEPLILETDRAVYLWVRGVEGYMHSEVRDVESQLRRYWMETAPGG